MYWLGQNAVAEHGQNVLNFIVQIFMQLKLKILEKSQLWNAAAPTQIKEGLRREEEQTLEYRWVVKQTNMSIPSHQLNWLTHQMLKVIIT